MDPSVGCQPKGNFGKKKCILSFDGGGVRGLLSSVLLDRLEGHLQRLDGKDARIADYFDEIAGTSTGALVACLLVVPDPVTKRPKYTAKDAINFYLHNAATVFPPKRRCPNLQSLIRRLTGPLYSAKPLEKLLKDVFGNLKLTDTVRPVIVPAYDISFQNTVLFSTAQVKSKQIPDCLLRDVCRASTAAPTYLGPYFFQSMYHDGVIREFNMVDGGVCANNPTFIAVSELLKDTDDDVKYEDLLVLSLGTGRSTVSYSAKKTAKWGTLSWIFKNGNVPILDMFTLASQDIVDYSMSSNFWEQSSHDNYLRIQTDKLEDSQMELDNSDKSNLQSLVVTAEKLLQSEAQMRNRMGEFVPDLRWKTYDAALSQFASWLVKEKQARSKFRQ